MGMAASQARFLGITARKASCEFKSTEIAQQKLEITNQLSDISVDYANAMNSTKLIWQNEAATYDYGASYGLLMTPSAMNNYNAYMVTTNTGAIVLNSAYAAAAKTAGISKAGGIGSQDSRDRFIAALVPEGIITQDSANAITLTDRQLTTKNANGGYITKDTEITNTDKTQNNGIVNNPSSVGWNPVTGMGAAPMDKESVDMMDLSAMILSESIGQQTIDWAQLYLSSATNTDGTAIANPISKTEYDRVMNQYSKLIEAKAADVDRETDTTRKEQLKNELNELKDKKEAYRKEHSGKIVQFDTTKMNTESGKVVNGKFTIVTSGVIDNDIQDMTLGDILARDIVLMQKGSDKKDFAKSAEKLLESFARILGYGQELGTGLYVDEDSQKALQYAMNMTKSQVLKPGNSVRIGGKKSDTAMVDNSAYMGASQYNRIGSSEGYNAISLSNMMSAFLTYYDNYLRQGDSPYVVGRSVETSSYVTDDSSYMYVGRSTNNEVTRSQKLADFFDQIYNSICEHGWREDAAIDDGEYFESMLKNSKYCLTSLNNDGYFYQTRYNETGYMVEVKDEDAIARAEAEFTQKKAELTYKEDSIDMKSKKLDAEISMLSNEYEAVKNLISKNIEKTFTMFSN